MNKRSKSQSTQTHSLTQPAQAHPNTQTQTQSNSLPSRAHSKQIEQTKGKSPSPQQSQSQRLVQLRRENELLREQHRRKIEEARNERNLLTAAMDVTFGVIKREALLDQIGNALRRNIK